MKHYIVIAVLVAASSAAAQPRPYLGTGPEWVPPQEAIEHLTEAAGARWEREGDRQTQALEHFERMGSWASTGINIMTSARDWLDAHRALTNPDQNCVDLSDAGAPAVPTSCYDDEACGECFTEAKRRIDKMRMNLERLRCVYSAAADYTKKSLAFGDSTSGIHAVTGLQWQTEVKPQIEKAFQDLQKHYDEKYGQMMPNLQGALEYLGQCEAQFFQNPDWYSRFGFIYYTFMADRYKRKD